MPIVVPSMGLSDGIILIIVDAISQNKLNTIKSRKFCDTYFFYKNKSTLPHMKVIYIFNIISF